MRWIFKLINDLQLNSELVQTIWKHKHVSPSVFSTITVWLWGSSNIGHRMSTIFPPSSYSSRSRAEMWTLDMFGSCWLVNSVSRRGIVSGRCAAPPVWSSWRHPTLAEPTVTATTRSVDSEKWECQQIWPDLMKCPSSRVLGYFEGLFVLKSSLSSWEFSV